MKIIATLLFIFLLNSCAGEGAVVKRICQNVGHKACIELISNNGGGAPVSDSMRLDIVSKDGGGRVAVLTVSSPDAVRFEIRDDIL